MGKGWAKGLTAATDPRVARAAAAHRGKIYQRRTPFEECRWPTAGRTTLPLEWSNEMAYIVGLTATDGCLFTGIRKINFKSEDRQLVETYLSVLGRTNRVKHAKTRTGGIVSFTEFRLEVVRVVSFGRPDAAQELELRPHGSARRVSRPLSARINGWGRLDLEVRAQADR